MFLRVRNYFCTRSLIKELSMKKITLFLLKAISIVIVSLLGVHSVCFADSSEQASSSTGYYYTIEYPDNQIGSGGALNLRLTPGTEQTFNLILESYSDEDMTIELSIDQAATNNAGGIQYGPNNIELDESLQYKINDCISVESEVLLPAKQTVTVPIKVIAPKESFDGIILGSLQMMKKGQEDQNQTDSPVTNVFAYLVGITLSTSDEAVTKELKLNKISAGLSNYRNSFLIDLSNVSPTKLDNFSIDATITSKDNSSISYSSKKLSMEMAPNSKISYPISLNGERFVSGKYNAHIKAASGSSEWEWDEEFTVSDDEADKYNREDVSLIQERGLPWKTIIIIIGIILILVLIVLFFIILYKKNKKKKRKN